MKIRRYRLQEAPPHVEWYVEVILDDEGNLCLYSDVQRLEARNAELLAALYIVDACGEPDPVMLYDGEAEGWEWVHPDGRVWHEVGCWEDPPPMHPIAKAAIAKAEGKGAS